MRSKRLCSDLLYLAGLQAPYQISALKKGTNMRQGSAQLVICIMALLCTASCGSGDPAADQGTARGAAERSEGQPVGGPGCIEDDPGCEGSLCTGNDGVEVCYPDRQRSFADLVTRYENDVHPDFAPTATNWTIEESVLGPPDYSWNGSIDAATGAVSLGEGGVIEVEFLDNLLTNSGPNEAPDLYVYEIGQFIESTRVAIRPADSPTRNMVESVCVRDAGDSDEFCRIGTIGGSSTRAIDIDPFFGNQPAGSLRFDAVRLVDDFSDQSIDQVSATFGADIDAIGAIESTARPTVTATRTRTPTRTGTSTVPPAPTPTSTSAPTRTSTQTRPPALPTVTPGLPCPETMQTPSGPRTYGYDDETVLAAGHGFDPEDTTKSFLQCLAIDRESGVLVQDEPNFAKTKFSIEEVTSRDELYRSLGLDIGAAVRSRVASASIDFSKKRSETTQADSLVFTVSGVIDYGKFSLASYALRPEYAALLPDERRHPDFFRQCGEMVVTGERKEIRFAVLYEYSNLSKEEKDSLTTKFRAAYSGVSVSGSASLDFENTVKALSRRARAKIDVQLKGGGNKGLEFLGCLLQANLNDPANVKSCIQQTLVGLNADVSVPISYFATPWTTFGFRKCFQPGIAFRDEKLTALFREHEELDVLETRLSSLLTELREQLLPPDQELPQDLPAEAQATLNEVVNYKRDLESYLTECVCGGEPGVGNECPIPRDYLGYCSSPNELRAAGTLPDLPVLPVDVAEFLYNPDRWSVFRWCDGVVGQLPDIKDTPNENTIRALAASQGQNPGNPDCRGLAGSLGGGANSVILRGYPSYGARPLGAILSLTNLGLEGPGTFFCDADVETPLCGREPNFEPQRPACSPETNCMPNTNRLSQGAALQRHRDSLTQLSIKGLGLSDADVTALLTRSECAGGVNARELCSLSSQCPGSFCQELNRGQVWTNLRTLSLETNDLRTLHQPWPTNIRTLRLSDNPLYSPGSRTQVAATFAPMTNLQLFEIYEPFALELPPGADAIHNGAGSGLLRNNYTNTDCGGFPFPPPSYFLGLENNTARAKEFVRGFSAALAAQLGSGRTDAASVELGYSFRSAYDVSSNAGSCRVCRAVPVVPRVRMPGTNPEQAVLTVLCP